MKKVLRKVFIAATLITTACDTEELTMPGVDTGTVFHVTQTEAGVSGNITSSEQNNITSYGFVWDTIPGPDINLATKISRQGVHTGTFLETLTGLSAKTTYYLRAYAINKIGLSYGNEISFTTLAHIAPTVNTYSASGINHNSASVAAYVFPDLSTLPIKEKGLVYRKTLAPTVDDDKVVVTTTTNNFTVVLTELIGSTKYYARAYAQTDDAITYGNEITFTTSALVLPSVYTENATDITITKALLKGNVRSAGSSPVTEKGIVYGILQNPTIENNIVVSGSGTGEYIITLQDLTENTSYFARAYAKSDAGIAYGNEVSFRTCVSKLPKSYLDEWRDLNGVIIYWITYNEEIVDEQAGAVYLYEDTKSITAVSGGFNVIGNRIGWPNPITFYLRQGADTNAITIGSSKAATKTLWKVTGRTVTRVTFGTGLAAWIQKDYTTTWIEQNDQGENTNYTYTETSRTDWSVFLTRNDGVTFRIDINTKAIFYAGGTMGKLYDLTGWYFE